MKFYLPGNAGSIDLCIDVDIGQSSEADRAFVAGLLRTAAGWLDPAPVVEPTPIISPAGGQTEETHERHDEPLPMHPVPEAVRLDGDLGDVAAAEPLLPGADQGGVEQEPVAEADVRATPTMTPEELQAWQGRIDAGDSPQVSKQKLAWTPERRAAQADKARRAGEIRNAARKSALPRAFSLKGPEAEPLHLTKEPPNAAILDTLLSSNEEPETTLTHFPGNGITTDLTPEDAAHEDAAIIRAHWPLHEEEIPLPPPAKASETLPPCSCPKGWWDVPRGVGTPRIPSSKHNGHCPLHRHRWSLPSASDDGEGGKYLGRCECGETKLHEPFSTEDNRVAVKKEQHMKAGHAGAAARTANRVAAVEG